MPGDNWTNSIIFRIKTLKDQIIEWSKNPTEENEYFSEKYLEKINTLTKTLDWCEKSNKSEVELRWLNQALSLPHQVPPPRYSYIRSESSRNNLRNSARNQPQNLVSEQDSDSNREN
ncbi:unnamed protein product [Soybean chlorotic mottle virus]|uniref:Uncharacterized protein 1b n=1 Tax=Soybean chlorotic mottle virus TaxID=10651 RepID=Y1B_SOCMV|nr:hypothetical protein SbCMVgp1 [Soybean chlorotic mottle virus]P15632.2 RecName: Full=Uncharacterized protein 1b [Soybean chlorotic mottle virus]CAC42878.1 unnamed protein product [Soybean chlorotic mottle virus]